MRAPSNGVLENKEMDHPQPQHFSLKGLLKSFHYALQGIAFSIRTQRNARIHLLASILVVALGIERNVSMNDWRWLLLCIALVWFSELINTAFEYVCDIIMPEMHASVKRAKDIAAGAVLVCASTAGFIGVMTLWPYFQ